MAQRDTNANERRPDRDRNGVGAEEWSVDAGRDWMLRDDEFLLDEDREYVVRDERSWREYVSPLLFGVVVAVMVGDVVTTGVGMAMGLEEGNPLVAAVIAEVGLAGLLLVKSMAAILLVLLPGVTKNAKQTFRAGCAAFVLVGLVAVLSNLLAIATVAG